MKHNFIFHIVVFGLLIFSLSPLWAAEPDEFITLCYHSVKQTPTPGDIYGISHQQFVEQMEYLRRHDYHVVSLDDLIAAKSGDKKLPDNPILLTFDDAYRSFKEFVVPVLEWYKYPAVLGVVGKWIDEPPGDLTEQLMGWEEIREMSDHELIDVVSHSYDLHKAIQYNPPGNVASAVSVRLYDSEKELYETEYQYRRRLTDDFKTQKDLFKQKLGISPRAIVWPYGRYNKISKETAYAAGCPVTFSLEEGVASLNRLDEVNRLLVKNEKIADFIEMLQHPSRPISPLRAVQVDLDSIYDPESYEQTDKNLGFLIERLVALGVNTVFLQAFADPDGDGNVESVYFHNRLLPVRADIFSHAVHQIANRGMKVYAWMPTLSIILPDQKLNKELRVMEIDKQNNRVPSSSWYHRLSPHSSKVRELMSSLYEDVAAHSQIRGILFQDDAYLTDFEDFNKAADSLNKQYLPQNVTRAELTDYTSIHHQWARKKTEVIIDFTKSLMASVSKYRPLAKFARNLYSRLLMKPDSELWFAQNYQLFLENYDQVVVMAYPQMEEANDPREWLTELVKLVHRSEGEGKTIFKLQTYDWKKKQWIKTDVLLEELRNILAAGGKHIAYYPDDLWEEKPLLETIRLEMSARTLPFPR